MLNPSVINEFLAKPRQSFDWCKAEEPPAFDHGLALWQHQRVGVALLLELKRFMLHIGMGGGKTLITLALIKLLKQQGKNPRAIVFVPYITAVDAWLDECAKHTPELRIVPLIGTTKDNLASLQQDADLYVICYQSAVAMVAERAGKKWQLSAKAVREHFAHCGILVLDEIHKCKNVSSLTYRMCRAISAQSEYVLGLTGTPFGKDLQDLWPQFFLIDFGETLGPTLGFYREVFFHAKPGYWGGMDYKFKQKLLPDLHRIIKNCSIHYSLDELTDLPRRDYVVRQLSPPADAVEYCKKALSELRKAAQGHSYRLVESNYLQLRQLSSGFMTLAGEDTDRVQVDFPDNPKLEALAELVESLQGEKLIVFHWFTYGNHKIAAKLKEMKVKHARVWGQNKNNLEELRRFKNDPDCQVLVINTRSGASSLNLQFCHYVCFFEQPDSPIDRQQAEARIYRPGQEKPVIIYDLLVRNTVDHQLHASNKKGENLLKKLLSGASL